MNHIYDALGLCLVLASTAAGAMTPEQVRSLPPPAKRKIVFSKDIQPILEASCIKCHGRGRARGSFQIDNRATVLRGGDSGPVVQIGKSQESLLIALVAGVDPDEVMPRKGSRLTAEQVGLLRAWIDQGLLWDARLSFARPAPGNLVPHGPNLKVPPFGPVNPIDYILRPYFATHRFRPPPVVDERLFARRVYLDVIGLLPPGDELDAFLVDAGPDKRARLVRRLLADRERYAQHWLSFWNDLLRNDYRGTGYIDGGRKPITSWLYSALAINLPYDRFVIQLVNPAPDSEGFTRGIVWRGVVNASQSPPMQAAQNISQVFMGVNLKCASCHDSFINDWRLADAYGLASVYADDPLELFQCDRPTGQTAAARFIYPQLGNIDPKADKAARQRQLAEIIAGPKNGRLSRTIVNRLWVRFFGRGLVEPLDDLEQPAWSQDLLDWLSEDLVSNGYDLKRTIERILTSRAYQLPAIDLGEAVAKSFVFRGPGVRRMSAEQFRDSLGQVTGVWFEKAAFPGPIGPIRASLVPADPLMTALGRPNREQVVTSRATAATTLQALELTNGDTLASILRHGAEKLVALGLTADALTERLYREALGRTPSGPEKLVAFQILNQPNPQAVQSQAAVRVPDASATSANPTRQEGVEDLLWAMVMLPEFQLIH